MYFFLVILQQKSYICARKNFYRKVINNIQDAKNN